MKTILTVEDNEQVRQTLSPMLELWRDKQGIKADIVETIHGAEALEWVKTHGQPDMLLLDVRMPVMGGAEFLRHTADLGLDLRPCTLLLTGYADDLEEHLGTDSLLMQHLRKPFMIKELFEALDKLNTHIKL